MKLQSLHTCLGPLLQPLSLPYAFLMKKRRALYESGGLASFSPSCPCVSVGNIAWGGTGKTPFTAWLLEWARQQRVRAVVLTRGYGADPGKKPLLVQKDTPAHQAGDEPLLLARTFPEASVVVFPQRREGARFAENYLNPQLFILDDGMQHLAVQRHADIVLLRPEDLEDEWNRVIPAGQWREGASALEAASVFAMKASPEEFSRIAPMAVKRLAHLGKPLFSFTLAPVGLRPMFPKTSHEGSPIWAEPCAELQVEPGFALPSQNAKDTPEWDPSLGHYECAVPEPAAHAASKAASLPPLLALEEYRDRPYILVSGVGNPAQVEQSALQVMGRPPLQHFAFDDHHPYSAADVQAMVKLSAAPLPVICTGKDAVKLQAFSDLWENTPVWILETAVHFGPALFTDSTFSLWWATWWQHRTTSGHPA